MAATNSPNKKPEIIIRLAKDYPQFKFKTALQPHWSPRYKTVFYNPSDPLNKLSFSVLHELGHAMLGHTNYTSDFELLKLEAEAWQLAAKIGRKYSVNISEDHIQNCLDTYRDWLHRRSTCPSCGTHVMQKDSEHYQCYNCHTSWHVTTSHFLRPYRKTLNKTKTH